ncbi:MAG: NAD(P)H-dependent oxidoreductase [Beijerinckiaceae bacterium]|nr:NAD(P)H-dependent oxidoreductase [Beijerinckiaceae bacterium]
MVSLLQNLNWRYATKKMDPSKKVEQDKLERILEAVRLTPTSSGLQPYQVLVITNQEIKEKIKAMSWDQSQVADCSHLLVFAAWDDYTAERINGSFDYTIAERGVGTNERTEAYRNNMLANYPPRGPEVNFQHTAKQTYIALGFALIAAAEEGVDATPMEGFDPAAVDELLGLRAKGLRSVTLLPLGYRDAANDWLLPLKKVRRARENFIVEIK